MKCRTLTTLFFSLSLGTAWGAGTSTGDFLTLGAGARIPSLGGAGTALSEDATSLYYNPALMTQVKKQSVVLMHTAYLDSSFFSQGAYVRNMGKNGAFGANLHYFSAGSIESLDRDQKPIGSISPTDTEITLGYARQVGAFALGVGGKYVKSELVDSASTFALDVGVLSQPFFKNRLRLGASVSNMGGTLTFEKEKEDLPLTIKAGAAYQVTPRLALVLDSAFLKEGDAYTAGGAEVKLPINIDWIATGRLGYNTGTASDVSGLTGVTFGAGISRKGLGFDYALVPQGDLGITHCIALTFNF